VTRPDFIYAVGVVSQYMHALRQPHFDVNCCILRYLKGALEPVANLSIIGFSNADWAGSCSNRWSTSGYCTFVGGNLVT
jgi:hypothetical protein